MKSYRSTLITCFIGYIVQAITVVFVPLLFVTFQQEYGISLSQLSLLVTMTFGIQICGDLLVPKIVPHIGQRTGLVMANLFAVCGLTLLSFLPDLMPKPFTGVILSVFCYSMGSCIIEVLVSPVAEACPTKNKEATMSLLHSFFCWGSVLVTAGSTLFFVLCGLHNWRILCRIWAICPLMVAILFSMVPLKTLEGDKEGKRSSLGSLVKNPTVVLLLIAMVCAGAAELSVSQWVSAFAEEGLHVSKTMGDLLGASLFAVMMGTGRVFYARKAEKIHLENFMLGSAALCLAGYLVVALSPWPVVTLLGCGMVGLGVAVLWPGCLSIGTKKVVLGGTALFALQAAAGDIGATVGPTVTGLLSDAFGGNLKVGIACAMVFPITALLSLLLLRKKK